MAWNDTELSINGVDKDGTDLITRTELFVILDQIKSDDKFFQIEPFEIMDIARSGNSLIPGQVIGRNIYSEQGKDADVLQTYLPLNSNIIQYPIVGEIWFGLHYGNENTKRYYLSRVPNDILSVNYNEAPNHPSALNEVSANKVQRGDGTFLLNNDSSKETKQGQYFKDTSPRKEIGNEGDTIIQGRFGNSISLGSRQVDGIEDSPQITINNKTSIVDLNSIDDIGLINVESDEILMTALTDEVNIRALKDININSSQGDVNIESQSNIVLKPRGSTTEIDVSGSPDGTIVNKTKEGINFPVLNMAGFLKQITGIQKVFDGLQQGVPLLPSPIGIKKVVKGLEGAKNFIEATVNLEFLDTQVLTTKTPAEIKASLPIPSGLTNVVGDIEEFSKDIEGGIQKAQRFAESNKAKLEQANQISAGIDAGNRKDLLALLENIPEEERNQIPGANDALAIAQDTSVGGGDIPRARDNGVFRLLEDYIAEQGSVEGDVEQLKMYGKILNLTK